MGDYYIGEIRIFPYNRIPKGWMACDGTKMTISQNQALYAVIGYVYGGDQKTYFNLPDLRGRVPVGAGQQGGTGTNYPLGTPGGSNTTSLTMNNMSAHTHAVNVVSDNANVAAVNDAYLAIPASNDLQFTSTVQQILPMASGTVGTTGGTPVSNMQPFLGLIHAICVSGGLYPPHQ